MKNLILFGISILVSIADPVFGEQKTITNQQNVFGGKTEEITYLKADNEYKFLKRLIYYDDSGSRRKEVGYILNNDYNPSGILKGVENYSSSEKLVSIEVHFLPDKIRQTGYSKIITHFSEAGDKVKEETYYSPGDFDVQIYSKSIEYFSISGEVIRTEFILSKPEAEKTGYSRILDYFEKGKVVKREIFDKSGNVFD